MRTVLIFLLQVLALENLSAQPATKLSIGDTVVIPDYFHLADSDTVKPMILDFFTSSCVVCFKSMPKLDSLYRRYQSDLQLVLVGKSDPAIDRIYARYKSKLNLTLPFCKDSVLFSKFGISQSPVYVWINKNHVVTDITGGAALTDENVKRFLGNLALHQIGQDEIPDTATCTEFKFSKWDKGNIYLPTELELQEDRLKIHGASVRMLYNYAFLSTAGIFPGDSRYGQAYFTPILEDGRETSGILASADLFQVDLRMPSGSIPGIKSLLQLQLRLEFGFKGEVQYRQMPYWSIIFADEKSRTRLTSKSAVPKQYFDLGGIDFRQQPIDLLVSLLGIKFSSLPPIIDETGFNGKIDIRFYALLSDFEEVKAQLAKQGLILKQKTKLMQVVVLKKMLTEDPVNIF